MNDKTTQPVKFEWNDDLVLEFARFTNSESPTFQGRYADLDQFKASKQPDTKEKESCIKVSDIFLGESDRYHRGVYCFRTNKEGDISPDKFPVIKQAIENVLNVDVRLVRNELGTDYYLQDGTKLVPYSSYEMLFEQNQELMEQMSKMFTKSELEEAESKAWGSAREYNSGCWFSPEFMKYPTLEDYRQSLNSINKEEKTKEQVVTDNSDVVGLKIDEDAFKNRCNVCGSDLVYIRGKYPNTDKRPTCPTCTTERLEQISEISNKDYGKAYQNKN